MEIPFYYYGSKSIISKWIIEHFSEHRCFVDVFGGSASILLNKPKSKIEVFNDLDNQIVNFFRVLRSNYNEFEKKLEFMPYSRKEFQRSFEILETDLNDFDRAFWWFYRQFCCFNGIIQKKGFRINTKNNIAFSWKEKKKNLKLVSNRFLDCIIENLDFSYIISRYDSENTLFYCDPPYVMDSRSGIGNGYVFEMSNEDHIRLLELLKRCLGKVVLSGYDSDLYNDVLDEDWGRVSKNVSRNASVAKNRQNEILWLKSCDRAIQKEMF